MILSDFEASYRKKYGHIFTNAKLFSGFET